MQPGDLNVARCHPADGELDLYVELIASARSVRDAMCLSVNLESGRMELDQASTYRAFAVWCAP